jgi:hypothetical protein
MSQLKYPELLPAESVQTLIGAAFDFKNVDTKAVVAAGYELAGYILGQTVGEPGKQLIGGDFEAPPQEFNGLIGARDPKKGRQIQQQVLGLLSLAYGAALFNRDQGIPAVLMAVNALIMREWKDLEEVYWTAKGQ